MKGFQVDIPKRSPVCFNKGEKFLPGMEFFSVLYEDEKLKIQRQDFCKACWEACVTNDTLLNSRGYWKSKIEEKNKIPCSDRAEQALKLLKQLMESPTSLASEIYVLAILLAHFRRIALRKEFVEEGKRYQLYEILHQDEFIQIQAADLPKNEIETIQQSLAAKLKV